MTIAPEQNPFALPSPHALVVDDDAALRHLIATYLRQQGFAVSEAANAAEAESILALLMPDALVLDIMMPGESGISFARRLRQSGNRLPVLLLSAKGSTDDRIEGLEAGADDYLPKPFEPKELLLRLRSILGRSAPTLAVPERALHFGPFEWILPGGPLRRDGELLHLTEAEADLLGQLAQAGGQPVSRESLQRGPVNAEKGGERQVDVLAGRLRKKIEVDSARPSYILTVRGQGYRLRTEM